MQSDLAIYPVKIITYVSYSHSDLSQSFKHKQIKGNWGKET